MLASILFCSGIRKEKYSYLRFLLSMSKTSLLKQDPEHQ
jgi:hypothetical protein